MTHSDCFFEGWGEGLIKSEGGASFAPKNYRLVGLARGGVRKALTVCDGRRGGDGLSQQTDACADRSFLPPTNQRTATLSPLTSVGALTVGALTDPAGPRCVALLLA